MTKRLLSGLALSTVVLATSTLPSFASSHREAPSITRMPKVDNTDFYMFRSFAPGRQDYVTLVSNYQPGESPGDGPNYYTMDPDALYEIHIDSNGDANEDITFQFKFTNVLRNQTGITVNAGGKTLPIALRHIGAISGPDDADQGEIEQFTLTVVRGDRRTGTRANVTNAAGGSTTFRKPFDNAGTKTFPGGYQAYADQFIYDVNIPGCAVPARMFVGQRAESFAVNLGPIFDLVNFVPVDGGTGYGGVANTPFPGGITQSDDNQELVGKKNVTSLALEVPISCLTGSGNGVIGGWTTASLPQARVLDPTPTYDAPARNGGAFVQVSRLGAPLVNEVVVGLNLKDVFNAAEPPGDGALADFVTNPTLPVILNALFLAPVNATLGANLPNLAPTNFPRNDLVATFLTGIATLNQQSVITPSEILRLNTGVPPTPRDQQNTFGVVGNDLAGFPNGRRPGDDVVDIALRVVMGRLCHPVPIGGVPTPLGLCQPADAPTGLVSYTDGAPSDASSRPNAFPYLNTPLRGAPRPQTQP